MSKALVFLAPGFEEIETSTVVDVLRRSGLEVTVAGLELGAIEGAHGMKVVPDKSIDEIFAEDFDAVICPGGNPGYKNLRKDKRVLALVRDSFESGKVVAAICAGPAVLSDAGILRNKNATIYPGMEGELIRGGGIPGADLVVEDGNIITSQGPATALFFALRLAERLADKRTAETVREKTLTSILLGH